MVSRKETIDGYDPRLLEYPFVYAGMTVEEYEIEKKYWGNHLKEVREGTYQPLWKQNKA